MLCYLFSKERVLRPTWSSDGRKTQRKGPILQLKCKTLVLLIALVAAAQVMDWRTALAAGPSSELATALAWQKEADSLMSDGKYREAAALYARALPAFESRNLTQDVAVLRHQLAFSLVGAGEDAAAAEKFELNRAYHHAEGRTDAAGNYTLYIAQAYVRLRDFERALKLLEEARDLFLGQSNRLAEIDHWRIITLEQMGRIDDALEILEEASQSLPAETWQIQLAADRERLRALPGAADSEPILPRVLFWSSVLLILGILLWLSLRYPRLRPVLFNSLLLTGSLVVTLGLIETFLRLSEDDVANVRHLLHPPNQQVRFMPKPGVMPGVDYQESTFTTNETGLRADPLPKTDMMRILAVGGSSTEALFLDDPDAWPHLLQQELQRATGRNIWVGNAGKSGLSSVSHVVQLHFQLAELHPDIVLVTAGINDLNQCVSGGRQAIIDNARFIREPDFPMTYKQYVFDRIIPEEPAKTWRLVELWKRALSDFGKPNKSVTDRFSYVVQDKAAEFYVEQRRRRQEAKKLDVTPDIQTCLVAFEENLGRMTSLANQYGAQLVLATQGSLYRDDLDSAEEALLWFGAVEQNFFAPEPPKLYYTAAAMSKMLTEYNATTLRVCANHQLVCLDTDRALPKSTASYYDDVHLNVQGSHTLARAFAKLLLDHTNIKAHH